MLKHNAKTVNKHDGVFRFCDNLIYKNAVKADSVAFVFTPTGLRFEKVQTVGRSKFQEMRLLDDNTALVNEDGNVKMMGTWDLYLAQSEVIQWINSESLSDDLKPLYDAIDKALTANNKNYSLARIGIGRTSNANNVVGLCVQWYTNTRKTTRAMGGLALTRSIPSKAQITKPVLLQCRLLFVLLVLLWPRHTMSPRPVISSPQQPSSCLSMEQRLSLMLNNCCDNLPT